MLRARCSRTENGWKQRIVSDIIGSFHISEVHAQDSSDRTQGIRRCRELLDIKDGPVLSGVLLHNVEFQTLYITAHHLVVDLVSWRIILHELQELVNAGHISISPTMSFQSWTTMQSKYAADLSSATYKAQPPLLSFWGINSNAVVEGATASNRFALDEIVIAAILGTCNAAFNTRPLELLAAALLYSFHTVFSERPLPDIFTEGHGREPWNDEIDVSHTVGWFTTIFPICVEMESISDVSLLHTVRSVKDWIRALSQNGWSHFTSHFADSDQAKVNAAQFPVEILLNFVGSFQQLERDDSLFENLALPAGCEPEPYSGLRWFAIFQVEAQTDKGCLSVTIDYPQKLCHHDKITLWAKQYLATLQRLTVLPQRQVEWTLADFPLVFKTYESITEFQSRVFPQLGLTGTRDIEDIYPCSPVQESILNAQEKDSRNYRSVMNFEMTSSHAKIDIMKIKEAWRTVVGKHQLLRAVFVKNESRSPGMITVILKYRESEVPLNGMDVAILAKERLDGLLLNGDLDLGGPIYRDFIGYIFEGTRK
ncbi:hypothetical protein TrVFT333_004593 [Trichoderma virens FT-333]|nr:hypothetical protein TrVFT333_004593 [Trichoderma virens FT-333]